MIQSYRTFFLKLSEENQGSYLNTRAWKVSTDSQWSVEKYSKGELAVQSLQPALLAWQEIRALPVLQQSSVCTSCPGRRAGKPMGRMGQGWGPTTRAGSAQGPPQQRNSCPEHLSWDKQKHTHILFCSELPARWAFLATSHPLRAVLLYEDDFKNKQTPKETLSELEWIWIWPFCTVFPIP